MTYRVVTGQKTEVGALFGPKTEMVAIKAVELITECIPVRVYRITLSFQLQLVNSISTQGTVIQAMAFCGGERYNIAFFSLISSILTSAFIFASITIEKDVDKDCRRHTPNFYGFVKLESKIQTAAICVLALIIAACQLASKAFALALGSVESSSIVVAYLVIEVCRWV